MRNGSEIVPLGLFDGDIIPVMFPIFPPNEQREVQKQLQEQPDKIQVLINNNYVPHFDPKILEKICKNISNYHDYHMYIISYVFNSYVSWLFYKTDPKALEDLHYLLTALIMVMKLPESSQYSYIQIAATCFYSLFCYYLSQMPLNNFQIYLDILRDFYTSNVKELPVKTYSMLGDTLKAALKNDSTVSNDSVNKLCTVIGILCEEHTKSFPQQVAQTVASLLTYHFTQLDISTLSLYTHLCTYLAPGSIHDIVQALPVSLVNYANTMKEGHKFPEKRVEHQVLPIATINESYFTVNPRDTFTEGLDLRPNITLPEKNDFEDLFTNEYHAKLTLILSTAKFDENIEEDLIIPLENYVKEHPDDPGFTDICLILIFFASHFSGKINYDLFFQTLLSTPVLDGNLTIFDNVSDYSLVDITRNILVEMVIKNNLYLTPTFANLTQYPALFAEIIHRIIRDSDMIQFDHIQVFVRFIMTSSLFYQSQHYELGDMPDIVAARTALLLLVSHVLNREADAPLFFNNNYFFTFYLSFLFEDALRSTVLSSLLTFLSSQNNEFPHELLMMLADSLQICFSNFPNSRYLIISYDVLQILNEVLKHRRSSTEQFAKIRAPFFSSMAKLDQSETSQMVLLQFIQFFALTSSYELLDQAQLSELESCIKNVFQNQFTHPLWIKLIQLIATDITPSLTPDFYIRQGEAVKLFLSISASTDKYLEAINYINSLVTFSTRNAVACHDTDLDLFVIDRLKTYWEDTPEATKALLELFTKIASIISSTAVVQRFISLFAPIEGRYLPHHQELYLDTLSQLISLSMVRPRAYMKVVDNMDVNVHGLSSSMEALDGGFSFCLWLWVDNAPAQYRANLLTIGDQKGRKIIVTLNAASLFLTVRGDGVESFGRVEMDDMPRKQWLFVVCTYQTGDQEAVIDTFINAKQQEPLEFPPMRPLQGAISARIGGLTPESQMTTAPARIAGFGLFPRLNRISISMMYEMGVRVVGEFPEKPIFYFNISDDNSKIGLRSLSKNEAITAILSSNSIKSVLAFTDILIMYCKVEMLLPLFAQLDMGVGPDGEPIKNLAKFLVELIGKIFSLSPLAQSSFHWGHGFAIIAHLLLSCDRSHIRYGLYKQFFSCLQSISHPFLQNEIFSEVLLNTDIWIRCDPKGLLQVLRHWVRVLVPSFSNIVAQVLPFRRILSILRLYFWYEPIEQPQILAVESREGLDYDMNQCRRYLQFIALTNAAKEFTMEDFVCLQSHCITCSEDQQVADNLWMLLQLGSANPSPLAKIQADFSSFLFSLFSRGSELIIRLIMKIIVVFAQNNLASENSIFEQVGFVVHLFPQSLMTPQMLDKLIKYVQGGMNELLPIAFIVAHQNRSVIKLLESIKPDEEFAKHDGWALWPLYVASMSDGEELECILRFLITCSTSSWENIYFTICIIGHVLDENFSDMKSVFVGLIAEYIMVMDEPPTKLVSSFFRIARFFILYRDVKEDNCALNNLMRLSPFRSPINTPRSPSGFAHTPHHLIFGPIPEVHPRPPLKIGSLPSSNRLFRSISSNMILEPEEKIERKTFKKRHTIYPGEKIRASDFIEKIIQCTELPRMLTFGIRLDDDGNWLDLDLAMKASQIFAKYTIREFVSFDIVLSSFLVRFEPEKTVEHVSQVALTEEERETCQSQIFLLNYNLKKAGMSLIKDVPEEKTPEGAFTCLQKLQFMVDMDMHRKCSHLFVAIRNFTEGNSKKLVNSLSIQSDELVSESLADIGAALDEILYHRLKNGRKWGTLWRHLAVDRAPWSYETEEAHFKRDNTMCAFFIPVKLKRNLRFDPHNNCLKYQKTQPAKLMEINAKSQDEIEPSMGYESSGSIIIKVPCKVIAPQQERDAEFVITNRDMKLLFQSKKKFIPWSAVLHVFFRRRFHRPNSIEVFLNTGKTYFIYFPSYNSLQILQIIQSLNIPSIRTLQTKDFYSFFQHSKMRQKWISGKISNFEYLMHLNLMSGRSFNDISQYPIMPWVLAKYDTETLDLNDETIYRDLKKVVGELGKERFEALKARIPDMITSGESPYLYGSGNSGMLSVCLYLLRLEPFASLHIALQKGSFDNPARLFSSMGDAYNQVTSNINDYRELTPEFFCMPEFLINHNRFDLGSTTRAGKIGDVILPPWAHTAMEFVYMHRKALESDYVTANLHRWIDNIWGVGQRTESNLFRPEMYDTIWDAEHSFERQQEIESILEFVGQVPPQLFREPHPPRDLTDNTVTFTNICFINPKSINHVKLSRVDQTADGLNIRVALVDEDGTLCLCFIDFAKLMRLKGMKKSGSRNSNSRTSSSGSGKNLEPPKKRLKATEAVPTDELSEIDPEDLNYTVKVIANFKQLELLNSAVAKAKLRKGRFAAISSSTGKVVSIDSQTGSVEELRALHSDATCIASDKDFLVVALQDSALCVFRELDFRRPLTSMPSFRDSIVCCAVSHHFYLIAMGTRDGSIVVNSLKGGTVRVVDLRGCRPRLLAITTVWGFVLAYMTKNVAGAVKHFLAVITVNGEILRTVQLEGAVVAWDTWASPRGFDYVVACDDRGRVFAFEAFALDVEQAVFRTKANIADVFFVRDIMAAVAVAEDGSVFFVPISIY